MKAQETTFERVLGGLGTQFRVPLYQRPYTWTRKQWEPLWQVVLEQATAIAEDERVPGHFLGSLVLAPAFASAGGPKVWLVVDGQQRLTTLSLLLCALRDRIAAEDPTFAAAIERNYLVNEREQLDYRSKLLPTQLDRAAYQACLDGTPPGQGNLGEAYRFFLRKLIAYDDPDDPNDLRRMEMAIVRRLELVEITAERDDNVHRIFESLNHTGMGLTQADLLRNYVFMLLPRRGEDVHRRYWQPMERALDEDSEALEWLARVDLVMRGNTRVTTEGVYEAHRERLQPLQGDEGAVVAEVADLARRARYVRLLYHPDEVGHDDIEQCLIRFGWWDSDSVYPAVMVLLERRDLGTTTDDEVVKAMRLLESFVVRRMLCGVPTNNLNRILNALPGELTDGPVAEKVHAYLSRERHYWPDDETLRTEIAERNFYWTGRKGQRFYVLSSLEDTYPNKEPIDWNNTKLSVEHVMPQTLSRAWRLDLRELIGPDETVDDIHREYLHTLGNITLTGYNSELSNARFERKRELLRNSGLAMNREIARSESWGPVQIRRRAERLTERAIELWPAPLPREMAQPVENSKWKLLRQATAALPAGSWTTYGELAELIGSHPVPVGAHIASRPVPNAWRVLSADGTVSAQFRWLEAGRTDDPVDILMAEGVKFDEHRRADPADRVTAAELAEELGLDLDDEGDRVDQPDRQNSFLSLLADNQSPATARAIDELLAFWSVGEERGLRFGESRETSCSLTISTGSGTLWPFTLYPETGVVEVVFQYLKTRPPFDNPSLREEFRQACNTVGDVDIPEVKIDLRPSFPMETLADPTALGAMKAVLDWFVQAVRG